MCYLAAYRVKLTVKSKKETNNKIKMGKESKMGHRSRWASVSYPLKESKLAAVVPPDRVKLTVKSNKETNSRVKMGQESRWAFVNHPPGRVKMGSCYLPSKWAKGQDGLLLLPPERVKMGTVVYPLTDSY